MEDKQDLIARLAHWVAAGKLEARFVIPVIQELSGDPAPLPLLGVLETIEGEMTEALATLTQHVREILRLEAVRVCQQRTLGQPLAQPSRVLLDGLCLEPAVDWKFESDPAGPVRTALRLAQERVLLASHQDKAPQLFRVVNAKAVESLAAAHAAILPLIERQSPSQLKQWEEAWPTGTPGRAALLSQMRERMLAFRKTSFDQAARCLDKAPAEIRTELDEQSCLRTLQARFVSTTERPEKIRILDCLCAWNTPGVVPILQAITAEAWAENRALLNLTLRFGQPGLRTWADWMRWQSEQARLWQVQIENWNRLVQAQARELFFVLYSQWPEAEPAVLEEILRSMYEAEPPLNVHELVRSWARWAPINEQRALLGLAVGEYTGAAPPILESAGAAAARPGPARPPPLPVRPPAPALGAPGTAAVSAEEPRRPPEPTLWQKHIQPLFVENWYIVAGIAMVLLGSSLLAYYTWDKHWLLRYTIMPVLLGVFTWSLAGVGTWIEKKGTEFKGTAAILRGAAIGLLPINFMAMALLSTDQQVSQKGPALLAMALVYLSVFGWGLKTWTAAVHPSLGYRLGGILLLLNALVVVGPFARTMMGWEGTPLLRCLGLGFYVGFVATGWTVINFARRILTRSLAEEKRVSWFVAGTLALTFVQVFVWVHGFIRHVPRAHTYALLVILTGWLVLYLERRASELQERGALHAGESFLGFALILLGLFMGFNEQTVRIVSFVVAGAAWMYQASSRRHPLHYWIALTLWALAVASAGLLTHFPRAWWPALGIGLALGFAMGAWLRRGRGDEELTRACRGMEVVALFLTAIVAPLVQWHYQSPPLWTAGWLLGAAVLFAWRALQDENLQWLHTTMLLLAVMLPYAGCVDMAGRTAHHNTMTFGLAVLSALWLGVTRLAARPLIRQARSTVLWFYGILAVAAMLLRVWLGDIAPDPLWYRDYMDYIGPMLMMLVLIPATYHSRSLVPAGMAVVIMVILFPELKANLRQSLPWLRWGSGLSSSLWGLGLVGLCFALRRRPSLKALGEGDRFLGQELFPLRRHDHTLFTWPIMGAALFLLLKVDFWVLLRHLLAGAVPLKTALALAMTGVAWTWVGIYHRAERGALVPIHLGWIWGLVGAGFCYWRLAPDPYWAWAVLINGGLLQLLYWFYRFGLEQRLPWVRNLLTNPTRLVLQAGSAALAVICMVSVIWGTPLAQVHYLYCFVGIQLLWHATTARQPVFSALLFFQVWVGLLAATAPGLGELWGRLSWARSASPTLWLLAGTQIGFIGLEFVRSVRRPAGVPGIFAERWSGLLGPWLSLASGLAMLFGLAGLVDGVQWLGLARPQQLVLLATLLLTARAHRSNFLVLQAMLLGYVLVHRDLLTGLGDPMAQLRLLIAPWPLALFGLTMVWLAQAGRWLHQRKPQYVAGPFVDPFFTAPSCGWIFWPALFFGALAAGYHGFDPVLRESRVQLWAPYLGTVSFATVAYFWPRPRLYAGAGFLLLLGNIHFVRVFGGGVLREHGLSELHLLCLGMALSLFQASLLRRRLRTPAAVAPINFVSLGLAGLILVLLSANYFTEPNLATITSTRFVVSGVLAWIAGRYFRRAARQPEAGEEAHTGLCEGLYHFGLVLAIWCGALLVPWFRQPIFTLIALGLPVLYFYARAELGVRDGAGEARRYRHSAAALGFIMLGLYLCKGIFQMILFPGVPIGTQHYHYNAPVILLLGVVLLRLHRLGGTSWLALYGGLAVMVASYFLITFLPGLSPFSYAMPSAWCAIALGHFWILLGHARSPLRTFLQALAGVDDLAWQSLARSWGWCLLVATQGAVAWGVADYPSNTYMVAPLVAGAASVFVHLGLIRRSPILLLAAALEVAVALHLDFLTPSFLGKDQIIWALLGIWLTLLVLVQIFLGKVRLEVVGRIAAVLALLVLAHVVYQRPWSGPGLWGVALGAILAAWNPQAARQAATAGQRVGAAALVWVPVWLVYFSQAPFATAGLDAALRAWPVLVSTATLLLTGFVGRVFPGYLLPGYRAWRRSQFRLFDATLGWLESAGPALHRTMLYLGLAIVGSTQVLHYQTPFAPREAGLLILLEAALAVGWFYEGKGRTSMVAYYLMQISALACFASIRRQLMLTTGFWNYEYDVWASLLLSCGLAGAKQVFDLQPRSLRVPLLTLMCSLPVMAMGWVMIRGLGVNMALLVVGLHSVIFAYLGKNERNSPYNIVALAGFVGFILITFYSKLQFRAIHAYIIPVGLGVLILQELFQARIGPETRNWVRLMTLMAMLGSSGYYALADERHAITFNLTMIVLCLLAMGLGSLLRVRLYLALGLAGLLVDLVSILYKALVHMERGARMTVIGSLVLVLGAIVVFGAIYYKTHKERFEAWQAKWRFNLGRWE